MPAMTGATNPAALAGAASRSLREAVPAVVRHAGDTGVTFDLEIPVRAISPGQSGACYADDDRLLGGGVIRAAA